MVALHPLSDIPTPALLLDERRMMANIARFQKRIDALGVRARPHMKTAKSIHVAHRQLQDLGPATVSTLREAEVLFEVGVKDMIYAVGIDPHKLSRVLTLRAQGCDLKVVLDSVEQAEAVFEASKAAKTKIPALIEIDSDGHRSGVSPNDSLLITIGRKLHDAEGSFAGVVTHAGESYNVSGAEARADFAERERAAVVSAAERLRAAGLPCPIVSVGSTPTSHAARHLEGVTEVRAGVYVFFDLVMAGIGVCSTDDIAISVLASVIGHQRSRGWTLIDAGWMAMSRDRGTASQAIDQGYGLVCDIDGKPIPDLIVSSANQEHGIVSPRPGSKAKIPELPVGTRLRILPNHACATAAQFTFYNVIPEKSGAPLAKWERFGGW
jgi:D-serine deaminase-like pyridoxal phosphate-dependent protein